MTNDNFIEQYYTTDSTPSAAPGRHGGDRGGGDIMTKVRIIVTAVVALWWGSDMEGAK